MSIIDKYIFKEILYTLFAVVLVLMMILLSANLVQIFRDVATGVLQLDTVLIALGLQVIVNFKLLLPLAFFLAILLALGRLYKDSEMVALAACGIGQGGILRSVLILSVVAATMTGAFSLYLSPWAQRTVEKLTAYAKASSDISGIFPGRFKEFSEGNGAIYVEEYSEDRRELRNVFGHRRTDEGDEIFSSQYGYQRTDPTTGDRYIILENGRRYEGRPGQPDYKIISFEKHGVRIEEKEIESIQYRHIAKGTDELVGQKNPDLVAELQIRISAVLLTVILSILAVPLSRTSPRQGQYARLALAILIYIIYTNLLNISGAWVQKGKIPVYLGVWWVHAGMLALGFLLVFRQGRIRLFSRRRPTASQTTSQTTTPEKNLSENDSVP